MFYICICFQNYLNIIDCLLYFYIKFTSSENKNLIIILKIKSSNKND